MQPYIPPKRTGNDKADLEKVYTFLKNLCAQLNLDFDEIRSKLEGGNQNGI